ncbi:kinase-like domain-containing protein [Hypoxylon argillaceum]|nr:kinase-like domain-containing protein [Hypoxylon argillaceum]KAI1146387.1 kinase-like domain-containing protein [Nemania diffusa]
MPARFPDRTFAAPGAADAAKTEANTCQVLVTKPACEVWALGSRKVLKSKKWYSGCEIDVENTRYAQSICDIPIPAILTSWTDNDRFITIQDRIDGDELESVKATLTKDDLVRIGKQLGQYLLKLRGTTDERMRMLDGRKVVDRRLFKPLRNDPPQRETTTNRDVRDELASRIAGKVQRKVIFKLMRKMPSALPFTFSHSDLHEGNIIIKDGQLSGLIDWELAGFYPVWWEYVNSCELLSDYLPTEFHHDEALNWFRVYHAIRERPEAAETKALVLEYLGYSL